jgi:hypothetical protein
VTHSPADVFTMQLARAAGKRANKFLYKRGLQKADRDDVIQSALLWCWVNRDNYSLTTTLETWFMNAIRDSYKKLKRAELPVAEETLATLNRGDETYNAAAAESSAEVLINALTPASKKVAVLIMQGYTRSEMMELGNDQYVIDNTYKRIKQLRRLMPNMDARSLTRYGVVGSGRTPKAPNLDELDENSQAEATSIDREIAQLDFAPPAGKDCPPCWRCCYFEGFMPSGKIDTRMEIADKEVEAAVATTNERKIEIAQQVRNGGLQLCHR